MNTGPQQASEYQPPSGGFSLRFHYPRMVLAFGGILTALATIIPWVSAPIVGGVSLWRLHSLVSGVASIAEDLEAAPSDSAHAGIITLFLPLGVLLLGLGAVALGGVAASRRAARIGAAILGAVTTATGVFGILVVLKAASGTDGVLSTSEGAFVLSVGGLVTLSGGFVGVSRDTTVVPAKRTQSLGIAGGYLVSAIGVGLLVTSLSILTVLGQSSNSLEPSPTPERAPEPPPTRTQNDTTTNPSPSEVVNSYFEAINDHDYHTAWELGGKNLSSSYSSFADGFASTAHDEWTTTSVNDHTVHGVLEATQTDGSHKLFVGRYTVSNGVITSANLTEQ